MGRTAQVLVIGVEGEKPHRVTPDIATTLVQSAGALWIGRTRRVIRLLKIERPVRVYNKPPDTPWTEDLISRGKPSNWGQGFRQCLPFVGHVVWSLKGVRGSK